MKSKISVVTLGVTDMKRSITFYQQLGLSLPNYDGGDFALFEMEGTRLALFPFDLLADDAGMPRERSGFSGITLAHNVSSREKVDAVMREAQAAGARVTVKPHETFWGGYSGYVQDPDGYLWEVAWNPFTDLT